VVVANVLLGGELILGIWRRGSREDAWNSRLLEIKVRQQFTDKEGKASITRAIVGDLDHMMTVAAVSCQDARSK
jgi:hypothetical protein